MTRYSFSYCCGILLIILQLNHALTLQEVGDDHVNYYESALDSLPTEQQEILIKEEKLWTQYRNLRCQLHTAIYQGNINQCRIMLTFRYNILLKLLRPSERDLVQFINQKFEQEILDFQRSDLNHIGQSFEINIANKLAQQYYEFYNHLDLVDQMSFKKSYALWTSHRTQLCLLLSKRNIIDYNYCTAKLSLDVISDMHNYLKY